MADQIYKAIPTNIGLTKIQKAMWTDTKLPLTHLAYGDGVLDLATMHERTTLVHEVGMTDTQSTIIDPESKITWVSAIIGSNLPECIIREIGLYDADGDLCFIANTPEIDKVNIEEGTLIDVPMELGIKNSYADYITIPLTPSSDYASKQWVYDVLEAGAYATKSLNNIDENGAKVIHDIAWGPIVYDVYEEDIEFELPYEPGPEPDPEEEIIPAAVWEDQGKIDPDNPDHEVN